MQIGEFINFVEIGEICIIGLGGWTPLKLRQSFCSEAVYVSLPLSLCLSLYICYFHSLSASVSLYLFLPLSLSLCHCVLLSLISSASVSFYLLLPLPLYSSIFFFLCLCVLQSLTSSACVFNLFLPVPLFFYLLLRLALCSSISYFLCFCVLLYLTSCQGWTGVSKRPGKKSEAVPCDCYFPQS